MKQKSHKPHSKHPNSHTNQEIKWIRDYVRKNPDGYTPRMKRVIELSFAEANIVERTEVKLRSFWEYK